MICGAGRGDNSAQGGCSAAPGRATNGGRGGGGARSRYLGVAMSDKTILITGAAGFIGFHIAHQLAAEGRDVVGLDNLNNHYDPALKLARLELLRANSRFSFVQADLPDRPLVASLFAKHRFAAGIHLAAHAGVRYSIDHPPAYVGSNLEGFVNVLEGYRHNDCGHLIYTS